MKGKPTDYSTFHNYIYYAISYGLWLLFLYLFAKKWKEWKKSVLWCRVPPADSYGFLLLHTACTTIYLYVLYKPLLILIIICILSYSMLYNTNPIVRKKMGKKSTWENWTKGKRWLVSTFSIPPKYILENLKSLLS